MNKKYILPVLLTILTVVFVIIFILVKIPKKRPTEKQPAKTTNQVQTVESSTVSDGVPVIGKKIEITTQPSDKDKSQNEVLFNLINAYRKENGISPLKTDSKLYKIGKIRANEIKIKYDETRPNGLGFHTVLNENGYSFTNADEVRFKSDGKVQADKLMKTWYDAPEKAEILLEPEYTKVAVGYIESGNKTFAVAILLK